jgi:uncharacterized membrane protein
MWEFCFWETLNKARLVDAALALFPARLQYLIQLAHPHLGQISRCICKASIHAQSTHAASGTSWGNIEHLLFHSPILIAAAHVVPE